MLLSRSRVQLLAGLALTTLAEGGLAVALIPGHDLKLPGSDGRIRMGLADYFDFSIYVDARTDDIERWYLDRFRKLRQTAFTDPDSYFRKFAEVPEGEAVEQARGFWQRINLPNLLENVLPTRRRATLVLRKSADHRIERVWLRKL